MSSESCYSRYMDEVETFEKFVFTSIGLTLFNLVASRVLVSRGTAPNKLAYYHLTTGSIKVCLALAIFATEPTCPSGCSCTGGHVDPLVALIPLVLGCLWLYKGYSFHKLAQQQGGPDYNPGDLENQGGSKQPTAELT